MTNIQTPSTAGKSHVDSPSEREIMLSKLRVAATRAKLHVTLLEDIQISLRQKVISVTGVQQRLHEEGISL
jgi:hypothetical protein